MKLDQQAINIILQAVRAKEQDLQEAASHFQQHRIPDESIFGEQIMKLLPNMYAELNAVQSIEDPLKEILDQYYDETSDNQLKAAYYQDLSLDAPKEELLNSLTNLISTTHANPLPYSRSKKLLHSLVDLHEDGKARSIYSGKSLEAGTLLSYDLVYEAAVREEISKYPSLQNLNGSQEDLLESVLTALALNVEHIIPQSWFDKASPMVGDLNHLFTCETTCNSFRSNIPYYDFDDYPSASKEIIRNDCGKRDGEERFEPQNGKGAVARANLYFLTRYPDILPQDRRKAIDIPMLIKWHEENPVTLYEKHRNWCIHHLQGNRNPYIDFPDKAAVLI